MDTAYVVSHDVGGGANKRRAYVLGGFFASSSILEMCQRHEEINERTRKPARTLQMVEEEVTQFDDTFTASYVSALSNDSKLACG